MKDFTFERLCEALDREGIEYTTNEDYSGRGMYGKTTRGIIVENFRDIVVAAADAAFELAEDLKPDSDYESSKKFFMSDIKKLKWDSMGLGIIVY